jgi:glycosyltransferase involved in cell wall biosynthesis
MQINSPSVSVIIPTYNYGQYIKFAIKSVLDQDYEHGKIEIIVVDDGSEDETRQILEDFILTNSIQYYFQNNAGKANATYFAIGRCTGKYIFNLDADDYFLPGKIKEYVSIFESDPTIVHVASPARVLFDTEPGRTTQIESIPADLIGKLNDGNEVLNRFYRNNIMFGGGTTYAAKSEYLKQIRIPDNVDMYIDEFLLLAILPFGKSYFLPDAFSVWRVHSSNYSVGKVTKEKKLIKSKRLLDSSLAVLKYIMENSYDNEFIKIYKLRHATRKIVSKELEEYKRLKDVVEYASEVFIKIKPGWKLVLKYNVLNRFLPLFLLNIFRSFKGRMRLGS